MLKIEGFKRESEDSPQDELIRGGLIIKIMAQVVKGECTGLVMESTNYQH